MRPNNEVNTFDIMFKSLLNKIRWNSKYFINRYSFQYETPTYNKKHFFKTNKMELIIWIRKY